LDFRQNPAHFHPPKNPQKGACVKILVEALVAAIEPFMASHTPTMPKMMHEKTLLFLRPSKDFFAKFKI